MSSPAEHPLLEVRHVENLTDAVRSLTHRLADGDRHHQQSLDLQRRQLEIAREACELMRGISESVDALREVIVKSKTNGNAHHDYPNRTDIP
jgi:hypothetical protein